MGILRVNKNKQKLLIVIHWEGSAQKYSDMWKSVTFSVRDSRQIAIIQIVVSLVPPSPMFCRLRWFRLLIPPIPCVLDLCIFWLRPPKPGMTEFWSLWPCFPVFPGLPLLFSPWFVKPLAKGRPVLLATWEYCKNYESWRSSPQDSVSKIKDHDDMTLRSYIIRQEKADGVYLLWWLDQNKKNIVAPTA